MSFRKALAVLAVAGVSGFAAAAHSVTPALPPERVSCQATHEISCDGAGNCVSEAGDTIHVNFRYTPATRRGDLCTYTYCRDFELLPQPTAAGQASPPDSGFTLSEHSGSTEEYQNVPVVDYQLSLDEDRRHFVLLNVERGVSGGWAGVCTAAEP
ncbi:MAG TPA: hypothetical protein PKY87_02590 [Terricaulis sp.]|nr:hypothetical protein [Terricaulis sp.]